LVLSLSVHNDRNSTTLTTSRAVTALNMSTRAVRMFETDVDRILEESRLHEDAPFASHANEVLDRVDGRDIEGM
jgi:hypothetical protein